jgi:hypothetical protein
MIRKSTVYVLPQQISCEDVCLVKEITMVYKEFLEGIEV